MPRRQADPAYRPGTVIEGLAIDAMTYGPEAVARDQSRVIFVSGAAPGDIADVVITEARSRFSRAALRNLRSAAEVRREPECRYVGRCGGCQWQHLAYPAQLAAKYANLVDHLTRIAGIADPPVRPVVPSPAEWHYRHRINLRVENRRLGFYRAESNELVEIEHCRIAAAALNRAFADARRWLAGIKTIVRRLSLWASDEAPGIVLVANAEGPFAAGDDAMNRHVLATGADGVIRGIVMFGKRWRHTWGDVAVTCCVDDVTLTTTGGEFTQVNLDGNRLLVDAVLSLGRFAAGDDVLDLYCGAGNLTLPIAHRAARVLGVERSALAIADAQANARRLGLIDCRFLCAPVETAVVDLAEQCARPRVVILDPPRGGAARILPDIARLAPERVIYVSCDPPTLARDLAALLRRGYGLETVQPLDLFPQTYHLEVVATLRAT
jgi:23S rRNA (uracil1939-C5)-methyltransferase